MHKFIYETLIEMDINMTPKLTGDYRGAIVTTFHKFKYKTRMGDEISGYDFIRRDWNYCGQSINEKLPMPYLSDITSRISRRWEVENVSIAAFMMGTGKYPEYMGDITGLNMNCMAVTTYFNDDNTITNECNM